MSSGLVFEKFLLGKNIAIHHMRVHSSFLLAGYFVHVRLFILLLSDEVGYASSLDLVG